MLRIVITGPESSGKTTLANDLARQLHTVAVPEFARTYLSWLGRPYTPEDLPTIYKGQLAWEQWFAQRASNYLICDTDWTVLEIWHQHIQPSPSHFDRIPWDFAFLCTPDIDWEPDPLREHPHEREQLFEQYHQLLASTGWPYAVISGSREVRVEKTLNLLQRDV